MVRMSSINKKVRQRRYLSKTWTARQMLWFGDPFVHNRYEKLRKANRLGLKRAIKEQANRLGLKRAIKELGEDAPAGKVMDLARKYKLQLLEEWKRR